MSVKNRNTLIRAYQLFADELTELQPVTDKNPEIAISFSQYIRAFSLCMILRVDKFNPDHKDFVNNLTVISLPEMDDEEYRHPLLLLLCIRPVSEVRADTERSATP